MATEQVMQEFKMRTGLLSVTSDQAFLSRTRDGYLFGWKLALLPADW